MKKPVPVELLEKYIKGECTQAEATLVKQWYASFEHEPDGIADISLAEEKELEERLYQNILTSIGNQDNKSKTSSINKWYKLAGAAAVILIASAVAVIYNARTKALQVAGTTSHLVVITNNSGQMYKANLPDNSSVWLSPHARLSFPKKFDAASRVVSMMGECFFEISKNPNCPFIINSHAMVTKVWGTSFLVRDNEQSNLADVSVLTGKVSVTMKPNHQALPEKK